MVYRIHTGHEFLETGRFEQQKGRRILHIRGWPRQHFPDFKKQAGKAVVPGGFDIYKPQQESENEAGKSLDNWLEKMSIHTNAGN